METLNLNLDKDRFVKLWRRCTGDGDDGANDRDGDRDGVKVFDALAAYYREPHRHYHTGGHINDCLTRMDLALRDGADGNPLSIELAVWFHDVIYIAGDPQNEQLSADWFAECAGGRMPTAMIREVEDFIISTMHREMPASVGAQLVVDADLSGLGMSPESFMRDGENIRREFPQLSDADFYRGQNKFLRQLLNRPSIYSTPFFQRVCEARARKNVEAVLKRYAEFGE